MPRNLEALERTLNALAKFRLVAALDASSQDTEIDIALFEVMPGHLIPSKEPRGLNPYPPASGSYGDGSAVFIMTIST